MQFHVNSAGKRGHAIAKSFALLLAFSIGTQAFCSELTFHFYGRESISSPLVPEDIRSEFSQKNCREIFARVTRLGDAQTGKTYRELTRESDLYREVLGHLEFVNRRFLENSPYSPETVWEFHERELAFPLRNTTYLVVTDPQEGAVAVTRIFDPNVEPILARLPLEEHLEGGHFIIPRRLGYMEHNAPFRAVELGRYAVIEDIPGAARSLLKGAGAHLIFHYPDADNADYDVSLNPNTLWVYMQTREALVSRMERLGFKVVAGPFQEKPSDPKEYVLEMSARQLFDRYFYGQGFTVVPERRK